MELDKSNSDILTPLEVARLFGVTSEAVRNWADAGKLPHFKTPGGQRRFHRADVEAFLGPLPKAAS
ncbi:MAG: helix-turn-helix domain-containing protein [Acidimicrobiales bacterium]